MILALRAAAVSFQHLEIAYLKTFALQRENVISKLRDSTLIKIVPKKHHQSAIKNWDTARPES